MRSARCGALARLLALLPVASGILRVRRGVEEAVGGAARTNATSPAPGYRVAVLTSGVLVRYFLEETAKHLIKPLVEEGHTVDYFLSLNTEKFGAWKGYARMFLADGALLGQEQNLPFVADLFGDTLSKAGANVRVLGLHEKVNPYNHGVVSFALSAQGWNNHQVTQRTLAARSNVMKLLYQFEWLWGKLRQEEAQHGRYDFVIATRDDVMWLRDFSLNRILQAPDHAQFLLDKEKPLATHNMPGPPRGYHVRCTEGHGSSYDAQREGGLTEYVFTLRRDSAEPFLTLFSRLTQNPKYWGEHNLESFLARVAEEEQIHLAALPSALVPMARAGRVNVNYTSYTCLHKACDSATKDVGPLGLPDPHYPICSPLTEVQSKYSAVPASECPTSSGSKPRRGLYGAVPVVAWPSRARDLACRH